MKKIYVKPEFEAVKVEMVAMVATSSVTEGETVGEGVQPGVESDGDDMVIGRRGSWGNRWE